MSFIESSFGQEDIAYEAPLRPQLLEEFAGQDSVCQQLEVCMGAAKKRSEPLGHCLFSGPPGLGKTTLSHIIAHTMGVGITVVSGPVIEKAGDLAGLLTKLKDGEVLFIDEIHRMPRQVEEYLYPAMEDFALDLIVESGVTARSIKVKLNRFTLVGATTRPGLLSSPLRSRFAMTWQLDHYTPEVLQEILVRTAERLKVQADRESLYEIARRSRGTPRIANNLLRWVRDFAEMRANSIVSREVVRQALAMRAIDERGLEEMDTRLLKVIIDDYQGGPVGLPTLAVALGEEPDTLQEVYEPFLIMQGLLKRTPRGRRATARAYEHIGRELPTEGGTT